VTDSHHIVFLCVANSARSQMAEALSRASAPTGWTVSSAGSQPSRVNPLALRVLAEIGLDIRHHRSKGLDEISLEDADLVVTLCAEEVCPVTPPTVERLSWAMADPAAVDGSEEERLAAFRDTRDEIQRRVETLWARIDGAGRG
jgi:thioredoxin type arsenate reductase